VLGGTAKSLARYFHTRPLPGHCANAAGEHWGGHRGAQLPSADAALTQGMLAARARLT
jgi:hypothetical protein